MAEGAPLTDRLVLGTVQLGMPYGRRRFETVLGADDACRILDAAWEIGIRAFDTAEAYGVSAERLAVWLRARKALGVAHVVTKAQISGVAHETRSRAAAAIDRFQGTASLTLMTHGPADANSWNDIVAFAAGREISLGQSVYTAEEVGTAIRATRVGRVQAPGNVFDLRALVARGQSETALDVRSIYLQGVLLDRPEDAEARVRGGGLLARAVSDAARDVGCDAAALLLATMLRELCPTDRVVIGVDNQDQLAVIGDAFALSGSSIREFESALSGLAPDTIDPRTLDPRTWRVTAAT